MVQSVIDYPGEIETWGPVHLDSGVEYVAYAYGAPISQGGLPAPLLTLYNEDTGGVYIADGTVGPGDDAYVIFGVPYDGVYTMDVTDPSGGTGVYRTNLEVYQGTDPTLLVDLPTFGPYGGDAFTGFV